MIISWYGEICTSFLIMNKKVPVILKIVNKEFVVEFEDQIIKIENIGWVSESIQIIMDHIPRKYKPITEDDLISIVEDGGECYLELVEVRNKAKTWEGSAINSFTTEEPIYTDEIKLIENKMVLHYKN